MLVFFVYNNVFQVEVDFVYNNVFQAFGVLSPESLQ